MRVAVAHLCLAAAFLVGSCAWSNYMPLTRAERRPGTDVDTKTAVFPDRIKAGDCGSDNVSVTIRSDGSATLESVSWTSSTHSGDEWWWTVTGFDVRDAKLWTTPRHKGPRMDDGSPAPRYHNDFDFMYDASKFGPTTYIKLGAEC